MKHWLKVNKMKLTVFAFCQTCTRRNFVVDFWALIYRSAGVSRLEMGSSLQLRPVNSPSMATKMASSMEASIRGSFSAKFLLVISILFVRLSDPVMKDLIQDVKCLFWLSIWTCCSTTDRGKRVIWSNRLSMFRHNLSFWISILQSLSR